MKFIRQDIHKKKRLKEKWRKPRGIDSKKRLMKNNRLMVKPGYGTKEEEKGKHFSGKEIVYLSKKQEIVSLNPEKHIVVLKKNIGLKIKLQLLDELNKKKIQVINILNTDKYLKEKKEMLEKRKKAKTKVKEKKETKETEKKDTIDDKLSDEEKKKLEKKEIDKLLTKRT